MFTLFTVLAFAIILIGAILSIALSVLQVTWPIILVIVAIILIVKLIKRL